jgi:hypothetical protein
MTKDEIREFVTNATFDTTMTFDEVGERDSFIDHIVEKWEQDALDRVDEAFTRGQHSMHPF